MYDTGLKALAFVAAFWLLAGVEAQIMAQEASRASLGHNTRGSQVRLAAAHSDYESATDGMRRRTMLRACGKLVVGIDYGRPSLGKRDLGSIQQGFVWRLGKGRPTILKATSRITFPGVDLGPGIYSLFLKYEGKGQWSLLIQRGENAGNPSHRDPEEDIAAIPLVSAGQEDPDEILSIALEPMDGLSARLDIGWGAHSVSTNFEVQEDATQSCR